MPDSHVVDRLSDHLEGDSSLAQRALVDAHLARCEACREELRGLRATVALLRGLPDPEPSARLRHDVMRRIRAGEARPPLWPRLLRGVAEPQFAAALAAGIAVFMMFIQFGGRDSLGISATPPPGPVASVLAPAGSTGSGAPEASRPLPVRWVPAIAGAPPVRRVAGMFVGYDSEFTGQRPAAFGPLPLVGTYAAAPIAPLRDLDGEISEAMTDPDAFVARIQRTKVDARRPLIAPLIEHSARRGDVAAVARHLGIGAQPAAFSPAHR